MPSNSTMKRTPSPFVFSGSFALATASDVPLGRVPGCL